MSARIASASLLAALGLGACTVGPTYRTPDVAAKVAPADFAETTAATSLAPPPPRWWRLYDDPVLDALVQKALAANTDLRQADANLRLAQAALSLVQRQRLPSTGLTASASEGVTLVFS